MEVKEKLEEFENKEEEADFRENLFMLHCSIACHDSISESQAIEAECILNACGGFFTNQFIENVTTHILCE